MIIFSIILIWSLLKIGKNSNHKHIVEIDIGGILKSQDKISVPKAKLSPLNFQHCSESSRNRRFSTPQLCECLGN